VVFRLDAVDLSLLKKEDEEEYDTGAGGRVACVAEFVDELRDGLGEVDREDVVFVSRGLTVLLWLMAMTPSGIMLPTIDRIREEWEDW